MIIYKDYITFNILGSIVNLISDETDNGVNTVAEFESETTNKYYYLGHEPPTLETAMFAWQDKYGRDFSEKEFEQVISDNNF